MSDVPPLNYGSSIPQLRTVILPIVSGYELKAGESALFSSTPITKPIRPNRVVVNFKGLGRDIRWVKQSSSKRKGRNMSNRYFAFLLRARGPLLTIDDIKVGNFSQMVGSPVPADIFTPDFSMGDVNMDPITPDIGIHMKVTNRDYQPIVFSATILGRG